MQRPTFFAVLLLAGVASAAPRKGLSAAERSAAETIQAHVLRAHVRFLASDLLEGRGPATRGDRLAQEYLASQFEELGLKPGAPQGGYLQPFDIVGIEGFPEKLSFAGAKGALELRHHQEFIAVSGTEAAQTKVDKAEVVFVGFGIVAPEYQWDDYKGADLKGKVLLMMNSDPEQDPNLFAGQTRLWYGRWDYKYESAAKQGAAGAIIIHTTPSAGYPWQVVQTSWSGEQFYLPHEGGPQLSVKAWTTEEATRRLVALAGKDLDQLRAAAQKRDFQPVPLGVTLSTAFKNTVQRKQTANVLGLLPGVDPKIGKQVVIYTAHHDHLGKSETAKPGEDGIYNGAVDNASGLAALLAVAQAFKSLPASPRRSILFAAVAAEEQGLLGSEYLAAHPPVAPGAMAANINIDGLNVWGRTRDITVIGLGKSNLDVVIRELAGLQNRTAKPDRLSDRGFFYRSDQFNFAKLGVPAAYFGSGMEFVGRPEGWGKEQREKWEQTHYHQPSDQLTEGWDLSGAVEDVQLYFTLGWRVAQQTALPMWNPGDEFENARKKALEAVTGGGGAPSGR